MEAVSVVPYKLDGNGEVKTVTCTIVANETPDQLPTTGEGIKNMNEDMKFAPLSVLMVVGTGDVYLANEDGEFVKQ